MEKRAMGTSSSSLSSRTDPGSQNRGSCAQHFADQRVCTYFFKRTKCQAKT